MNAEVYEQLAKELQERGYKELEKNKYDWRWAKSFDKYFIVLFIENYVLDIKAVQPVIYIHITYGETIKLELDRWSDYGIEKIEAISESIMDWVENNDKLFSYESKD